MNVDFLNIDNIQLAFLEKNSLSSKTVFLIHGNSGSKEWWYCQYTDNLFFNYRMIAVDLPGHGESSKGAEITKHYSPIATAQLLLKAIVILSRSQPYVLVGFSYGTNLVAEILQLGAKPAGVVLAAPCILGKGVSLKDIMIASDSIYFQEKVEKETAELFFRQHIQDEFITMIYLQAYSNTDRHFRPALFQAAAEGYITDEIAALQSQLYKILVISSKNDPLIKNQYLSDKHLNLWHNNIFLIEETGHFVIANKYEKFNELLYNYLQEHL